MKPAILNHIGIAVSDLSKVQELFKILGLTIDHSEPVIEQGVVTHFVPLPVQQGSLEFLEATDPEGTIAQFIKKKGAGIHHLSFQLSKGDLEPVCAKLSISGYKLIYAAPKLGAHNMRVNFIHPATTGGILIEVMEQA